MKQVSRNNTRESVIDQNLRKVFEETLDEGIPDRFKDLLDQLRQQDQSESPEK